MQTEGFIRTAVFFKYEISAFDRRLGVTGVQKSSDHWEGHIGREAEEVQPWPASPSGWMQHSSRLREI